MRSHAKLLVQNDAEEEDKTCYFSHDNSCYSTRLTTPQPAAPDLGYMSSVMFRGPRCKDFSARRGVCAQRTHPCLKCQQHQNRVCTHSFIPVLVH